jgi:virginiamycin B lyase
MVRETTFIVLGMALATSFAGAPLASQNSTPGAPAQPNPGADGASSPRVSAKPTVIPFTRLTPDAKLPVALAAGAVAASNDVWTADLSGNAIIRLDAKTNVADPPVALSSTPCASLAVAFETVWVPLCSAHLVARVSLKDRTVSTTVKIDVANAEGRIADAVGSIWLLTSPRGVLSRIDPDANAAVAEVYVAAGATAVAAGENALWITSEAGNRLTRVSPHTNETIESVEVGPKPGRLAVGEGGVWTLNRGDGSVTRVDPTTNKVVATIAVDPAVASGEIVAGAGSIWISAPGLPIVRIDPRTNRAVQKFTGEGGGAILVGHGSLWVAAGPKMTWRLDPLLVSGIRP